MVATTVHPWRPRERANEDLLELSGLRSPFHARATTLRPIYFVNSTSFTSQLGCRPSGLPCHLDPDPDSCGIRALESCRACQQKRSMDAGYPCGESAVSFFRRRSATSVWLAVNAIADRLARLRRARGEVSSGRGLRRSHRRRPRRPGTGSVGRCYRPDPRSGAYVTCSCREWPFRIAGARPAGRPGWLPPPGWTAIPPVRVQRPGRCPGTAACPGRQPRGR